MHIDLVCVIRTKGVRHKQVCTRVDSVRQKNCPSPCPARGLNSGSSDEKSDALPPSYVPYLMLESLMHPEQRLGWTGGWHTEVVAKVGLTVL